MSTESDYSDAETVIIESPTETAAVPAATSERVNDKLTHAQRLEKKRAYMAARYRDLEFREAKRLDILRRYHERYPEARWGIRGRRPKNTNPEIGVSAVAAILAGTALGAAVAACL